MRDLRDAKVDEAAHEEQTDEPFLISFLRRGANWAAQAVLVLFLISFSMTLLYRYLPVPLTPLMAIRLGEGVLQGRGLHFEKNWFAMSEISPRVQYAMIAAEDMRFFEHNGFDWEAIDKALKHNQHSHHMRGASTISQQVAKNVFLWPDRSWMRKALEAYFTTLIETFWPKSRIMEVYMNVVELGDGIYGVGAASRIYFKKNPSQLNSSEAALLAAVLPNPRHFSVLHPSPYIRLRQTMIQRRMRDAADSVPDPDDD